MAYLRIVFEQGLRDDGLGEGLPYCFNEPVLLKDAGSYYVCGCSLSLQLLVSSVDLLKTAAQAQPGLQAG